MRVINKDNNKAPAKRMTLKAVADALGVSTASISNAFNRPDQLSAILRDRILKECERLGYHGPNPAARSLRTGATGVVGVMLAGTSAQASRHRRFHAGQSPVTEHR